MRFAIVAHSTAGTTAALAEPRLVGCEPVVLTPAQALCQLDRGDTALGRLDVQPSLAGIEPKLWALDRLARRGVRVLNGQRTLRTVHDKLLTASVLARASLPHPRTKPLAPDAAPSAVELPAVIKPRFGSWGRDVMVCSTASQLESCLVRLRERPWFRATGALVQELVPPRGYDLRLVVAGNRVVGAIHRIAPAAEWRTNVALGARRERARPPDDAHELALAAAAAVDGALVGVDLLPTDDGFVVLEVNGAVDFTQEYSLDGDIFANAVSALTGLSSVSCPQRPRRGVAICSR
jgi:[lysine-biosynthesis-protein LysW]--L-2-aminoadipate ligase